MMIQAVHKLKLEKGRCSMNPRNTLPLLLGLLLLLSLLTGCGTEPAPSAGDAPPADSAAPAAEEPASGAAALGSLASFTAGTLDGETFTQEDIAAKDATVVNFWSTTCGPCIAELPDLAAFAGALPDNVQVITVCLDGSGNEERAAEILEEAGFEGPTLISGDGDLLDLSRNLMYTPTTVFADSGGTLRGEAVIGGREDLSGTFLEAVNQALADSGKEAVSLATS